MKPQLTINRSGTKFWYLNSKLHRIDGPAVIYYDSSKLWYLNGKFHRTDGPAIISPDGLKYWFLNAECFTQKIWLNIILSRNLR